MDTLDWQLEKTDFDNIYGRRWPLSIGYDSFQPLTIFAKKLIVDVWEIFKYTCDNWTEVIVVSLIFRN